MLVNRMPSAPDSHAANSSMQPLKHANAAQRNSAGKRFLSADKAHSCPPRLWAVCPFDALLRLQNCPDALRRTLLVALRARSFALKSLNNSSGQKINFPAMANSRTNRLRSLSLIALALLRSESVSLFPFPEMQNKSKKFLYIKSFSGISIKTIDCNGVFDYTNSKEAIP